MPCRHVFQRGCIKAWLGQSNACPTCRYEVETESLFGSGREGSSAMEPFEGLKDGDHLVRRSDGVVRDLTYAYTDHSTEYWKPLGVRPAGEAVLEHDHNERKVVIDTVFAETIVTTSSVENLADGIGYQRPNVLARTLPTGERTYEDWESGEPILSWSRLPHPCSSKIICGSQLTAIKCGGTGLDPVFITCSDTKSERVVSHEFQLSGFCTFATNESIIAYIPTHQKMKLILLRLKDKQRIAEYDLPNHETVCELYITRFIVIVLCKAQYWVFDLNLNPLFNIPRHLEDPDSYEFIRAEDWGLVFTPFHYYRFLFKVLAVLDPKVGRFRKLSTPLNKIWEERKKERESEREEGKDDDVTWQDMNDRRGYYFSTIEYPVDDEGRRTGAAGTNQHYWRWVNKWCAFCAEPMDGDCPCDKDDEVFHL
ncbi:hypothetical protein HDV00_008096 [Rhizophlyctis rosea]|nr:hypothetical protein HDV00_008096 [Rhizophlyctis rosea]